MLRHDNSAIFIGGANSQALTSGSDVLPESDDSTSIWTVFSDTESEASPATILLLPLRTTLAETAVDWFFTYRATGHQRGTPSDSKADGWPSNHLASSSSSNSSLHPQTGKRSRSRGSGGDKDEDRPVRRRVASVLSDEDERLLACPFSKNNPRRHRVCHKYILRDVSRLKYVTYESP
jgi:hypothetical protein